LGFDLTEKAVRRAGLDYWKHVELKEHASFEQFLLNEEPKSIFYFTSNTEKSVFEASFDKGCYLIFGKESCGLPKEILDNENSYKLPNESEHIRSLNLASAATAIGYECYRQITKRCQVEFGTKHT